MKFKELRKKKGFNKQQDLAKACGIKQTTLSKWEQGKARPKLETIQKLSVVLQVSNEEIMNCFLSEKGGENESAC